MTKQRRQAQGKLRAQSHRNVTPTPAATTERAADPLCCRLRSQGKRGNAGDGRQPRCAALREASAGTARSGSERPRSEKDGHGSHRQHRVGSFCRSLNGIRQLLQFLVISALASVFSTLRPVSISPPQVVLHRVSPPNHAVPKAGQERLEDDVFYVSKFPAFGSLSHRSEGSKCKRQERLTESLRTIGEYSLLPEPQLVF